MPRTRRDVLRAALVTASLVVPLAACGPGYPEDPDSLAPLVAQAEADAEAARTLAGRLGGAEGEAAGRVAEVRTEHAEALRREVERANRPAAEPAANGTQPAEAADLAALEQRLTAARESALEQLPEASRYRAGLLGSVAAGCAAVQQLSPKLGAGQPDPLDPVTTGTLEPEAVTALQEALAAEHAAVWIYGLASAYLPADFDKGVDAGAAAHRERRDASERVLTAAGVTPQPAEPAYVPTAPVTDQASAVALVAVAESDAATAWRGVLERTDDAPLRTMAAHALLASATRATSWRAEANEQPAAVALPGTAA
ncbi:protein of unknown function [Amycolatopsis marina]|uniref:DUF4439 domain-containing protein n=1 Tax=Amycolatopsis marina TaxID=490629 RepID=A0A1I1C169_9PSEU|nr:DUF4439 domain-containing protein [Amycolatopsis marina]SFB55862.1 protein of unknown function [Amycolatopsis marina]